MSTCSLHVLLSERVGLNVTHSRPEERAQWRFARAYLGDGRRAGYWSATTEQVNAYVDTDCTTSAALENPSI